MTQELFIQKLIDLNEVSGSDQEIRNKLREIYRSKQLIFMEQFLFFRIPLFV